MTEQFARVARPSSGPETPGVASPRGINRNHLTLYLSVAAILLSVAAAGVQLITFFNGHQQQLAAQADLDRAQKGLVEVQKLKEAELARAARLESDLKAQQIRTAAAQEQEAIAAKINHIASARNNDQDTAKKRGETATAEAQGYLNNAVIKESGIVPALVQSVRGTVTRGSDLLGVPSQSSIGLPPTGTFESRARREPVDPLANPGLIK